MLDVVHGISLIMDEESSVGRPFNVGAQTETAIIELAGRVIERTGSSSKVMLLPYEEAYDEGLEELGRRKPDTTAIEELTGWKATRTVDEAIDDVIAYDQHGALAMGGGLRIAG